MLQLMSFTAELVTSMLSFSVLMTILSRWISASQYQNVSILHFIGAKDDGGDDDSWSYNVFKAQSDQNHQHINTSTPSFFQVGFHSCRPTNSAKALKEVVTSMSCSKSELYTQLYSSVYTGSMWQIESHTSLGWQCTSVCMARHRITCLSYVSK